MLTRKYDSPCGRLLLGVSEQSLCLCDWMREGRIEKNLRRLGKHLDLKEETKEDLAVLQQAERELGEYFRGERRAFEVSLTTGGTEFQREVWRELQCLPYGESVSYKELAGRLSRPAAVRAVANAIGANALSIFIPCHRVTGSGGSQGGYAGGVEAKRYLLELEERQMVARKR